MGEVETPNRTEGRHARPEHVARHAVPPCELCDDSGWVVKKSVPTHLFGHVLTPCPNKCPIPPLIYRRIPALT